MYTFLLLHIIGNNQELFSVYNPILHPKNIFSNKISIPPVPPEIFGTFYLNFHPIPKPMPHFQL